MKRLIMYRNKLNIQNIYIIKQTVSLLEYVCVCIHNRQIFLFSCNSIACFKFIYFHWCDLHIYISTLELWKKLLIFKFNEKWDMLHRWKVSSSVMKITENFTLTFVGNYYQITAIFTRFTGKSSKWCLHPFHLSQIISENIYTQWPILKCTYNLCCIKFKTCLLQTGS